MLHVVMYSRNNLAVRKVLELCDRMKEHQDHEGNTVMHSAIDNDSIACIQSLFYYYPNLQTCNHLGEAPLYYAAKKHSWDVFMLLLERGAPLHFYVTKKDDDEHNNQTKKEDGSTTPGIDSLLVFAYRDRERDAFKLLLEKGANVSDIDSKTGWPVWYSICQELQHMDLIDTILKSVSDLQFVDTVRLFYLFLSFCHLFFLYAHHHGNRLVTMYCIVLSRKFIRILLWRLWANE